MKIAIFSGAIPSSTFIESLIKGASTKHQVLLFGVVEELSNYQNPNIRIYSTPANHLSNLRVSAVRLFKLSWYSPKAVRLLWLEILRFSSWYERWIWFTKFLPIILYRPDILHLQWARDLEFYYFLQTKFQMKLVVSLRGAHINYTPIVEPRMAAIYREAFPNISHFHAVSEAIAKGAQLYGARPEHITVIHSPLPPIFVNAYQPLIKSSIPIPQLLIIGRFHWIKGYDYAITTLALLKAQGIIAHLNIVGPNSYTEEILFQIHQLGLESQVTLLGKLPQEQLPAILRKQHALLLPSLEEGIANVVLEAMAVGLPVISTNCGGMAEVVVPNETGWLVPFRDPQALADAILAVHHASEADLRHITQNAHNFVKEHFNAEKRIAEFLEWYEGIVISD